MNSSQKNTISKGHFLRSAEIIAAGIMFAPGDIFAQVSPVITIIKAAAKEPITGHGAVGNYGQLMEFRDMLVSIRENV